MLNRLPTFLVLISLIFDRCFVGSDKTRPPPRNRRPFGRLNRMDAVDSWGMGICGNRSGKSDIEIILERAKEKYPEAKPRIISDNGPQFIARDFKEFIRISGMTHVRTSPYYPQSNGKLERWHKSLKSECIRPLTPLSVEEARRLIRSYVDRYNTVRLHSAIGYVTPQDMLAGRQAEIHAARDRKLEEARRQRQLRREQATPLLFARSGFAATMTVPGETEAGAAGTQPC